MGRFGDWSKKTSKYLKLEYGERVEVSWTGDAEKVKSTFGEGWEFSFMTPDGVKQYTIRNTSIVAQFDNYNAGDMLVLQRGAAKGVRPALVITKAGEEVAPIEHAPIEPAPAEPTPF